MTQKRHQSQSPDTQHNDIQRNDNQHNRIICEIQHNGIQNHNDAQHNNSAVSCHAECCILLCYADFHYPECCSAEHRFFN